jgi:hypothetical protein
LAGAQSAQAGQHGSSFATLWGLRRFLGQLQPTGYS